MLGLRAKILRRLGFSCVEMGARVTGDVQLGKGVCVASGADIIADPGGRVEVGDGSFLLKRGAC